MSDTYVLSQQADRKIDEFWSYYFEAGGIELANRIIDDILTAIERLAEFPHRGHPRTDLTDGPYLFYVVHAAMIIYDPDSTPLYVYRIYHVSQDPRQMLSRGR